MVDGSFSTIRARESDSNSLHSVLVYCTLLLVYMLTALKTDPNQPMIKGFREHSSSTIFEHCFVVIRKFIELGIDNAAYCVERSDDGSNDLERSSHKKKQSAVANWLFSDSKRLAERISLLVFFLFLAIFRNNIGPELVVEIALGALAAHASFGFDSHFSEFVHAFVFLLSFGAMRCINEMVRHQLISPLAAANSALLLFIPFFIFIFFRA